MGMGMGMGWRDVILERRSLSVESKCVYIYNPMITSL